MKLMQAGIVEHVAEIYKMWFVCRDHMPKKARTLIERIDVRVLDVIELLQAASFQSKQDKVPTLDRASRGIDVIKILLRITWEVRALDTKKYTELSEKLDGAGKQVGGWKKEVQRKTLP